MFKIASKKAHLGKPRAAKPRVLASAQDLKTAGLPKGITRLAVTILDGSAFFYLGSKAP